MAASIQGIYLALFGRPADPAGLEFFNTVTGNGADLTAIGDLASTAEYQSRFVGMDNEEIINSIYQSLFGRDGEASGIDFYLGELAAGRLTINTIAIGILNGAQGSDLDTINAKIAAANLFTTHLDLPAEVDAYDGNAAAAIGREFIATVNASDPGTAEEADAAILKLFPDEGQQPGGGGGVVNPPPPPVSGENVDLYDSNGDLVHGYSTIQAAVNAVGQADMKIVVHAGVYNEQITVSGESGLTITGEGAGTVINMVDAPVFNEGDIGPRDRAAVISVLNSSNVTVTNLVVDGLNKADKMVGGVNSDFIGVFYGNSSGTVVNTTVQNIADPLDGNGHISGAQRGTGILVFSANGGQSNVLVEDNYLIGFQKNGITASENGTVAHITGNTVVGAGLLDYPGSMAQNGIQVSWDADGEITGNHVSGIGRMQTDFASSNILVYLAKDTVSVHGNDIDGVGSSASSYGVAIIGDADFGTNDNDINNTEAYLYQDASGLAIPLSLYGTDGPDQIYGGSAGDFILVNGGSDIVEGGGGNDTIDLDETVVGTDQVIFEATPSANGVDQIHGFQLEDKLDFTEFIDPATLFIGPENSNHAVADNEVIVIKFNQAISQFDFGGANYNSMFGVGAPLNTTTYSGAPAQAVLLVEGTDQTQIYYIDTNDFIISDSEVTMVGVLTDVTVATNLTTSNFTDL